MDYIYGNMQFSDFKNDDNLCKNLNIKKELRDFNGNIINNIDIDEFIDNIVEYTNINLWNNQKILIKDCILSDKIFNVCCLAEKPGSGKTYVIISLLQYLDCIYESNERTLIVINNNIYDQWIQSIKNFPKLIFKELNNYAVVTSIEFDDNIITNDCSVYFTTPLYYHTLCGLSNIGNSFNRIIVDEIDNLKHCITKNININKFWAVSATFDTEVFQNLNFLHYKIIKNDNYEFKIPEMEIHKKICSNLIIDNILSKLFTSEDNTSLNALDYVTFKNKIGITDKINDSYDIITKYKEKIEKEKKDLEINIKKLQEEREKNDKILENVNLEKSINTLQEKYLLQENEYSRLQERIIEEQMCMICYEIMEPKNITINTCCCSIFCKECIQTLSKTKSPYEIYPGYSQSDDTVFKCPWCSRLVKNKAAENLKKIYEENYDSDNDSDNEDISKINTYEYGSENYDYDYGYQEELYGEEEQNEEDKVEQIKYYNNIELVEYDNSSEVIQIKNIEKNEKNINKTLNYEFYQSKKIEELNLICQSKWNEYQNIVNYPSKMKVLKDLILNNIGKKILIFNEFSNIYNKLYKIFDENNIKNYKNFDTGNIKVSNEILQSYKNGYIDILLLDGIYNTNGINLENTDIIILMHKTENELQLIARAQRFGRKTNLQVYKLLHLNEE